MIFKKRASLALSTNAIVVVVIAFVVLGLGLTLTRTIFGGAQEQIPKALELTALEAQPSAGNPITITGTVKIPSGGTRSLNVGFYNRGSEPADQAIFEIAKCIDEDGTKYSGPGSLSNKLVPNIINLPQDVGVARSAPYNLIFKEKGATDGLPPGKIYICNLEVRKDGSSGTTCLYEKKQIRIEVIS